MSLVGQSIGRYHIVEQLGQGGMAAVYKAFDTRLERQVAIKVIRQDAAGTEHAGQMLRRFEREAKSLARLSHANIVKVHDYGETGGSPYLVMEYIQGGTLSQMTGNPVEAAQAARLLAQVARALDYAHSQKIIHRDVKPANILMTEDGRPMLTDFGIAKLLESDEAATSLTGSGLGIGTPEYMSPEQCLGKQVDARSDIYSLGVVFYEMVTGRKPYTADTPMAVVVKHINDPLLRPRHIIQSLPEEVERVIFKAMAKEPDERYQNMALFADALDRLAAGGSIQSSVADQPAQSTEAAIPAAQLPASAQAIPAPLAKAPSDAAQKKRSTFLALGIGLLGVAIIACLAIVGTAGWLWMGRSTATQPPIKTARVQSIETKSSHTPLITMPPASPPLQSSATPTPEMTPTEKQPYAQDAEMVKYAVDTAGYPYIGDEAVPDEEYSDEDYDVVNTMFSFSMSVSSAHDFYIWKYGWCTTTEEILDRNMQYISIELYINGEMVPPEKIYQTRGPRGADREGVCDSLYVLLENWPPGDTYLLELLIIDEPVHDGWSDYPEGMLMREYRISLSPTN